MSKVAITGNASGSGVLTIAAPNTNTDRTLTLPDEAGTVLTSASAITQNSGPAFSAYQSSAQYFSANTWTKVQFQTEEYDTDSCFDNATNYRFTATVAGYYQVSGAFTNATFLAQVGLILYKNGSGFKRLYNGIGGGNTSSGCGSCQVYLNGSTDYIELYAYTTSAQNSYPFVDSTYFQAAMVRAA